MFYKKKKLSELSVLRDEIYKKFTFFYNFFNFVDKILPLPNAIHT